MWDPGFPGDQLTQSVLERDNSCLCVSIVLLNVEKVCIPRVGVIAMQILELESTRFEKIVLVFGYIVLCQHKMASTTRHNYNEVCIVVVVPNTREIITLIKKCFRKKVRVKHQNAPRCSFLTQRWDRQAEAFDIPPMYARKVQS